MYPYFNTNTYIRGDRRRKKQKSESGWRALCWYKCFHPLSITNVPILTSVKDSWVACLTSSCEPVSSLNEKVNLTTVITGVKLWNEVKIWVMGGNLHFVCICPQMFTYKNMLNNKVNITIMASFPQFSIFFFSSFNYICVGFKIWIHMQLIFRQKTFCLK